eukprot:scaffold515_cov101-Isochrysis_galbana.AAC.4
MEGTVAVLYSLSLPPVHRVFAIFSPRARNENRGPLIYTRRPLVQSRGHPIRVKLVGKIARVHAGPVDWLLVQTEPRHHKPVGMAVRRQLHREIDRAGGAGVSGRRHHTCRCQPVRPLGNLLAPLAAHVGVSQRLGAQLPDLVTRLLQVAKVDQQTVIALAPQAFEDGRVPGALRRTAAPDAHRSIGGIIRTSCASVGEAPVDGELAGLPAGLLLQPRHCAPHRKSQLGPCVELDQPRPRRQRQRACILEQVRSLSGDQPRGIHRSPGPVKHRKEEGITRRSRSAAVRREERPQPLKCNLWLADRIRPSGRCNLVAVWHAATILLPGLQQRVCPHEGGADGALDLHRQREGVGRRPRAEHVARLQIGHHRQVVIVLWHSLDGHHARRPRRVTAATALGRTGSGQQPERRRRRREWVRQPHRTEEGLHWPGLHAQPHEAHPTRAAAGCATAAWLASESTRDGVFEVKQRLPCGRSPGLRGRADLPPITLKALRVPRQLGSARCLCVRRLEACFRRGDGQQLIAQEEGHGHVDREGAEIKSGRRSRCTHCGGTGD